MPRRYERNTFYQPPGTDSSPAESAGNLRDVLLNFSKRTANIGSQLSSDRGRAQGIQDGSSGGAPPKKRSSFTASGSAYNEAATAAYVAKQQLDIEDTYGKLEEELPDNPSEFEARSEGYRKGLLSAQNDPELRLKLDVLTEARASEGARRVRGAAVSKQRDQQRVDIQAGIISKAQALARKVPQDTPESQLAFAVLKEDLENDFRVLGESGLLTPSQLAAFRQNVQEDVTKGLKTSQVLDLTSRVIARFDVSFAAGTGALRSLDRLGLDDETKVAVQKEVRERVALLQSNRGREYALDRASLAQDIAANTVSEKSYKDAFFLFDRGAITDEQYVSTIGQIGRAAIEQAKDGVDLKMGLQAYENSTPLDPSDSTAKKMMNQVFKNSAAGVERGSAEYQNLAIEMVRRTNIAPADAISWARAIVSSGDPQQAAQAAQFLGRLEQTNPAAYRYLEEPKLKAFVGQFNAAVTAGTPSDISFSLAYRNTYELTEDQRKAYQQRYTEALKGPAKAAKANADALKSYLDSDDVFDKEILSGAPEAPVALQAEFNAAVERYYPYTRGDLEQARERAWQDVRGKWGYSTVNGEPELLAYAPEIMNPQIPVEVIQQDLASSARKIGFGIDKPRLVAAPGETAGTNGLVWNIGYLDEYGSVEIARDFDGRPYRYQLPVGERLEDLVRRGKAEKNKAVRENVERQRLMRKMLEEQAKAGDEDAFNYLMVYPDPASGIKTPAGDQ